MKNDFKIIKNDILNPLIVKTTGYKFSIFFIFFNYLINKMVKNGRKIDF